jgi:hypothetical protein
MFSRVEPWLLAIVLVSYLTIFLVPYVMGQTLSAMRRALTGINPAPFLAAVVVLLVAGYSGFTLGIMSVDPEPFREQWTVRSTPDPGKSVLDPGTYQDRVLSVDGPVTVGEGETLELVNTTMTFDPAPGSRWGLWVAEGGHLELRGSTVRCVDTGLGYDLEVHGSAEVVDSVISGTKRCSRGPTEAGVRSMDTGFEVYSDEVVFRNTTFMDHNGMGVLTYECSPLFENCTFTDLENDAALGIIYGNPTVVGCTFEACYCATWVFDSTVEFRNCTFTRNREGMYLEYGSPRIVDCVLEDTWYIAIYDSSSDPVFVNLVFADNGEDVHEEEPATDLDLWQGIIMLYIFPVMLLIMRTGELIWERLRLRKEAREQYDTLDLG